MSRRALYVPAVIAALFFSSNAYAQETDPSTESGGDSGAAEQRDTDAQYEELTEQAEQLFTEGEYDQAISLLERAYELKKYSNTLYNIARVYEEKGDLEGALEYYDQFVVAPKVNLEYRKEALERSKTIREILAAQEAKENEKTQTADAGDATTPKTTPAPEPAEPVMRPSPWRPVGFAMTGIGVAAVGAGAVVGALALGAQSDFDDATDIQTARDSASRAESLGTVADVLYISGAVVGVTGLVIAIAASPVEVETAKNGKLDLMISPTTLGAGWTWKF